MEHLNYKGYKGSAEYSREDECFHGQVLGLENSLILYEGSTLEELKEDFEESIENYLDRCLKKGVQPEKVNDVAINIRIPSYIHSRIAAYAKRKKTSVSRFISEVVERQMEVALPV